MANFTARKVFKQKDAGTYNFANDADGSVPSGWTDYSDDGCTAQVISNLDGHNKVIELYDNNNPNIADIRCSFSLQSFGTVEYWIRTDDVSKTTIYYLGYDGSTLIYIAFSSGYIIVLDDTTNINLISSNANQWYHIRIDFRASGGSAYMGLAEKEYYVYVDGVRYGSYTFYQQRTYSVNMIRQYSHTTTTGYYSYIDAFGYSWDTNYKIGDNVYWRHYKESTDSFEGDDWGTQGTSITWVDGVDTAASVEIVPEFGVHKKILRQDYTSGVGGFDYSYHTLASQATAGWWAGWIKTNDVTNITNLYLKEDTTIIAFITFRTSKLQYWDNVAQQDAVDPAVNDTWYFIYMQWYADNTWDLWVNNVLITAGITCDNNQVSGVNRVEVCSVNNGTYLYLDAPICSLDSDVRGNNRTFDYLPYSYTDITANIHVARLEYVNGYEPYIVKIQHDDSIEIDTNHILLLFDENSILRFEGNFAEVSTPGRALKTFVDLSKGGLSEESTYSAVAAENVNATMLGVFTNIGHENGRLIYYTEDNPAGNLTPIFTNKPKSLIAQWAGIHSGSPFIRKANGVCYLDSDDSLGITVTATSGHIKGDPIIDTISHQINKVIVRGGIDPDTGTPFEGTSEDISAQTDGTEVQPYYCRFRELNSAADCLSRATQIRTGTGFQPTIVEVVLSGVYGYPNQMISFAYAPKSFTATNMYIESVEYDLMTASGLFVLNTGYFDATALSDMGYNIADETADNIARTLYLTDIATLSLHLTPGGSAVLDGEGIKLSNSADIGIGRFYASSFIDITRPITLDFIFRNSAAGGARTTDGKLYLSRFLVDGSEDYTVIEVGYDFDAIFTENSGYYHKSYTYDVADLAANQYYRVAYIDEELDAHIIYLSAIQVTYYLKRTV